MRRPRLTKRGYTYLNDGGSYMSAMYWDPKDGSCVVLDDDQVVPKGFLCYHPNDPKAKTKTKTKAKAKAKAKVKEVAADLSFDEVLEALVEGGVVHSEDDTYDNLVAILHGALKATLVELERDHSDCETTRDLLEKVRRGE